MKPSYKNILLMLRESNYIEDERDRDSLVQAHRAFKYITGFESLNNEIVKNTHSLLMKNKPISRKHIGDWRDQPVSIGGQLKVQPKIVIDSLMRDYCDNLNNLNSNYIEEHIKFENIHPFIDGNGRIGRIIMNWHSIKRADKLIVFLNEDKHQAYYPIFDSQHRHINNAYKYLEKEIKTYDYYSTFSFKTRLPRKGIHSDRTA